MRIIYDPNTGADSTSSVQSTLLASRSLCLCNLYTFANRTFWKNDPFGDMAFWTFTDADFPIAAGYLQLFASGSAHIQALNNGGIVFPTSPSVFAYPSVDTVTSQDPPNYTVGFGRDAISSSARYAAFPDIPRSAGGALSNFICPISPSNVHTVDLVVFSSHQHIQPPPGTGPLSASLWSYHVQDTGSGLYLASGPPTFLPSDLGEWSTVTRVSPSGDFPDPTTFPFSTCVLTSGIGNNIEGNYYDEGLVIAYFVINAGGSGGGGGVGGSFSALYLPEAVKHSSLTYEVGLTAQNVDVTWFLKDQRDYFGGGYGPLINPQTSLLSMKAAMTYYRAFDDCPFWIHRAICDPVTRQLLGTTLMYRGFIRKTEAAADYLKISLGSLLDIIQDTQVPNQQIQPSARTSPFLPFPNVAPSTLTAWPSSGTTITRISAKTYQVGATGITANQLQDCWVTFNPAASNFNFAPQSGLPPLTQPSWRIQSNTASVSGSGGSSIEITFYDPPVVPNEVGQINLFSPNPQNVGAPGFPYLPAPENSL